MLRMGWRTRLVVGLLAWPVFLVSSIGISLTGRSPVVSGAFGLVALVALVVGLVFPPWALISWARRGDRAERAGTS